MDGRTGADRDSSTALPTGQTSRGYPKATSKNPKDGQSRQPNIVGMVPQEGGAALRSSVRQATSTNYSDTPGGPNVFSRGGDIPTEIPRGYTDQNTAAPSVSRDVSSNRFSFGIDPGSPPQPDGDTTDSPGVPKFGVGTNGE